MQGTQERINKWTMWNISMIERKRTIWIREKTKILEIMEKITKFK